MDKLILYSKEYFDTLIKDSHCYYAHLPKKVGILLCINHLKKVLLN